MSVFSLNARLLDMLKSVDLNPIKFIIPPCEKNATKNKNLEFKTLNESIYVWMSSVLFRQ